MSKILRQFRYYGENENGTNPLNAPAGINKVNLRTGEIFRSASSELASATIVSLGIQAIPGTQFYINDSADSIIIGSSGIYELSLNEGYEINHLHFSADSLDLIDGKNGAYLIIDTVYNTEE